MAALCAICHREVVEAYKPFCSKRCADIDLAHWLTGTYAIPAEPAPTRDSEDGFAEDDDA